MHSASNGHAETVSILVQYGAAPVVKVLVENGAQDEILGSYLIDSLLHNDSKPSRKRKRTSNSPLGIPSKKRKTINSSQHSLPPTPSSTL